MKLSDVVQMIRGKRGTVVRLEVLPVGSPEKKIYNITRAQVELKDSEARGEIIEEKARRPHLSCRRDRSAQLLYGHGRGP